MKRKFCLVMALMLSVSLLSGCGSSNNSGGVDTSGGGTGSAAEPQADNGGSSENAEDEGGTTEPVDPRGRYDETVTLTSFFQIAAPIADSFNPDELKDSYYIQKQEENTNIHVEYLWYANDTADDSDQKKNVAIASGEIPDFMLVNPAQLSLLAKTDLINKDIGNIFNQYASEELMAWTTGEGSAALESASYGGQVIAIPLVDSSIDAAPLLWIRQDWLDNLGLDMPTTMDEFYDVMVAFKNDDPDGNGIDDTIGMTLHKDLLSMATGDAVGLFNGFGAYPGKWVEDGNGGLTYGSTMSTAKDALDFLAKLYAEGLVEEDFSSKNDGKASEVSVSGKSGVQYGVAWNAMWPLDGTVANNPDADWIPIAIVSDTGQPARPQIALRVIAYVVVSEKCENPEAVVKLLNFWVDSFGYSTEEEYQAFLELDNSGVMTFPMHNVMLKTWFPLKNLEGHLKCKEALETGDPSKLNAEELSNYNDNLAYREGDLGKTGPVKTTGTETSAYEVMSYYYDNDLFMMDQFYGPSTPTMTQKQSIINDKVIEYYTKVIMGIESTDNFEKFVDELNKLGLEDITKEVNEWYTSK